MRSSGLAKEPMEIAPNKRKPAPGPGKCIAWKKTYQGSERLGAAGGKSFALRRAAVPLQMCGSSPGSNRLHGKS